MISPLKKFVKLVISKDRYFFTLIVIFLFLSVPITVFAILQSRSIQSMAVHQDCFDLNGDFKVTQADIGLVLNNFGIVGQGLRYDIDHSGSVSVADISLLSQHNGEICTPKVSFWADSYSISQNTSTRLRWSVNYATFVSISPSVGAVGASGSKAVSPASSTTYTLTASNLWATTRKQVTISVSAPRPSPSSGSSSSRTNRPGSNLPGGPSTQNVLNALDLKISAPSLIGEVNLPIIVGGKAEEVKISNGAKVYSLSVSRHNFSFGQEINLLVGGKGVLTKGFRFIPDNTTKTIDVGVLDFGDLSGDDMIDESDVGLFFESLTNQTVKGDINVDGVTNSLDWALLQKNIGKVGQR